METQAGVLQAMSLKRCWIMTQLEYLMNSERSELYLARYIRFCFAFRRCSACLVAINDCATRLQNLSVWSIAYSWKRFQHLRSVPHRLVIPLTVPKKVNGGGI